MQNQNVRTTIESLLEKLGVTYTDITEEVLQYLPDTIVFTIETPEARLLIGHNGDGFQALNHLVSRFVTEEGAGRSFVVDVNGYFKDRMKHIQQKTFFGAERARSLQSPIELEPMNAFERLIVHNLCSSIADISTESVGVGRERRVVLKTVVSH